MSAIAVRQKKELDVKTPRYDTDSWLTLLEDVCCFIRVHTLDNGSRGYGRGP